MAKADESAVDDEKARRWKKRFLLLLVLWLMSTILMSLPGVRGWVSRPLYVSNAGASGDCAYVMADGFAYWERLHAAADLYHMKRVPRIVIPGENSVTRYSFVRQRSETMSQRATEFLKSLGVPPDVVSTLPTEAAPLLGSWSEARAFAKHEGSAKQVIVVTSAPHTRRSLLCFNRALPKNVDVTVFAATGPSASAEVFNPIWLEYLKLAGYSLFVW